MNKSDFMGAMILYLSMSGSTRFALEVYAAALCIDFDALPAECHLHHIIEDFYWWVSNGRKEDKKPSWLKFREDL